MTPWMGWGLEWIYHLQPLGPVGRAGMQLLSFAGSEYFYFLVFPIVLWCIDAPLGIRTGLLLVGSASVNEAFKVAFGLPRPYWISRQVAVLSSETSFGLPSGHAQTAFVVWGRLAAWVRRYGFTLAAAVLVLAISFSRIGLGVHFPLDVFAGWAIGGVVLGLAIVVEDPVLRRISRWRRAGQLALAAGASVALIGIGAVSLQATRGRVVPAAWQANASAGWPGHGQIGTRTMDPFISRAGAFLGLGTGAVLLTSWGGFRARTGLVHSAARYATGILGVLICMIGLAVVFPSGDDLAGLFFRYLRYSAAGFWIAYGAPRAFAVLRLG